MSGETRSGWSMTIMLNNRMDTIGPYYTSRAECFVVFEMRISTKLSQTPTLHILLGARLAAINKSGQGTRNLWKTQSTKAAGCARRARCADLMNSFSSCCRRSSSCKGGAGKMRCSVEISLSSQCTPQSQQFFKFVTHAT